jgi:hypothetical protein
MKEQISIGSVVISALVALGFAAEDKYSLKVPEGLAFSGCDEIILERKDGA